MPAYETCSVRSQFVDTYVLSSGARTGSTCSCFLKIYGRQFRFVAKVRGEVRNNPTLGARKDSGATWRRCAARAPASTAFGAVRDEHSDGFVVHHDPHDPVANLALPLLPRLPRQLVALPTPAHRTTLRGHTRRR